MQITTTSNSGLTQLIYSFEPPLKDYDINIKVIQPENEEQLLEEHKEKYTDAVYIPHWREIALVMSVSEVDPKNLELTASTSYHVQAIRKGKAKDAMPVVVEGLILTYDNKFVYGVRGGKVEEGKACIAPAGQVSNNSTGKNPIFSAFYEELTEELGINNIYVTKPVLIGYQTDPDFTKGINFVLYAKSSYISFELEELHNGASSIFQKAMASGASKEDAKNAVKGAGYTNIDAWEHTKLLFVDNNPDSIEKIISSRTIGCGEEQYPLLDIGRGPLMLYKQMTGGNRK